MIDIQELIENPEKLNRETLADLKELTEKYPFFQAARLLYVRNLFILHSPDFGDELRKASVFVPDRTTLFSISEGHNYELGSSSAQNNKTETEDENRTMTLITGFLEQSKTNSQKPSLVDLTTDYASFLMKEDEDSRKKHQTEAPLLKGAHLIDSFIEETKGKQRVEMKALSDDQEFISPEITEEEGEIYTEKMVDIYIKQQRYVQALEILRKICLNNPEKNATFASQINLLEVITSGKQL